MKRPTIPTKKHAAPGKTGPRSVGRLQREIDATVVREIVAALEQTGGRVAAAAELLGISKVSLWKRMKSFGIKPGA
jgi:transcriptional regulator of acetoin/glycerol metabolism